MNYEYSDEVVLGSSVTSVDLETLLVLASVRINYFYKVTTLIVVNSSSMGFNCDLDFNLIFHLFIFRQCYYYLFVAITYVIANITYVIASKMTTGGAYIRRGLSTERNLRLKIDWASGIVDGKFTVFALFYFVFEGNFPSTSPRVAFIWRGDSTEGFFRYRFRELIHGGAYFRNFMVVEIKSSGHLSYRQRCF